MQPQIAIFRIDPTGRFRAFSGEVSQKNPVQRSFEERRDICREKPACIELVSFENRYHPRDLGRGRVVMMKPGNHF